jgi:hypothetical protein
MELWIIYILPVLAMLVVHYGLKRSRRYPSRYNTVQSIQQFLEPTNGKLSHLLHSRALANGRLINAFNIRSTFVSGDKDVRDQFNRLCRLTMNASVEGGWNAWKNIASDATNLAVPDVEIRLDDFFCAITFMTATVGLLGANPASIGVADAANAARTITHYWVLSKLHNPPKLPAPISQYIERIIRDRERFPNPIELVLPTVEPLWRLIAVTFIYGYDDPGIRKSFAAFYEDPTAATYNAYDGNIPSVNFVIQEALRLHPPICRISRAEWTLPFPFNNYSASILGVLGGFIQPAKTFLAADIEAVQKSSVWGEDAHMFQPMRHSPNNLSSAQKETLMAFGHGKMKCIARDWAPMAVAIIAAAALDAIQSADYELVRGQQIGRRAGWDGWFIKNKKKQN